MVTTKWVSIEYTQRETERESNHVTILKNQQNTKESSKRGKDKQKVPRHTKNKVNGNNKSFCISNH